MKFIYLGIAGILIFVVLIIILIINLIQLNIVKDNTPRTAVCNPESLLSAWIRGENNTIGCPQFSNNLVVSNTEDGFQLFRKDLRADERCCWFSENTEQRNLIDTPDICNAVISGNLTLNQLNQKPYRFINNSIQIINPSCDTNPVCMSVRRRRDDTYNITKSISGIPGVPIDIQLDEGCSLLRDIKLNNESILQTTIDGRYVVPDDAPENAKIIVNLYNTGDRFLPVPADVFTT